MYAVENPSSAVIIPGLACNEKASVLLPLVKETLLARGVGVACLDGIVDTGLSQPYAKTPQELGDELASMTQDMQRPPIVISHCLGAITLVEAMSQNPDIQGVMIAPPLGDPFQVLRHPSVTSKQETVSGGTAMQVKYFDPDHPYDFSKLTPREVLVTPEYDVQIMDASSTFAQEVRELYASGRLSLVVPEEDWNTDAAPFVDGWVGNKLLLPGAKHSLNVDNDAQVEQQRNNVAAAVDFFLS